MSLGRSFPASGYGGISPRLVATRKILNDQHTRVKIARRIIPEAITARESGRVARAGQNFTRPIREISNARLWTGHALCWRAYRQ